MPAMSTHLSLKALRDAAAKLPTEQLEALNDWCCRLIEQRSQTTDPDDPSAISLKEVLKRFRHTDDGGRYSRQFFTGLRASEGATMMKDFYEGTRVRQCRFKGDGDMLLVQWGPVADRAEYSFSCVRQLIPAGSAPGEIRQLKLDFRYPMSERLKRHKPASRWFRSLNQLDAFDLFVFGSPLVDALDELKSRRVSITYGKVD
jgi:hypothetical protein